jgi:hypothetical protein
MVSRANLSGRPRPSGVLKTVQDGGLLQQGPRTELNGERENGVIPDRNGEDEPPPPPPPPQEEPPPPYPPGKGPDVPVPPTQPNIIPGGSRRGAGHGYRARTSNIARETTEEQEQTGRWGRFGAEHVGRYGRTIPPGGGVAQGQYGRRYGRGEQGPRWSTSEGGGGYGTIPPPLPPPEPPPEEETPPTGGLTDEEREARRLRREERQRRRGNRPRTRRRG